MSRCNNSDRLMPGRETAAPAVAAAWRSAVSVPCGAAGAGTIGLRVQQNPATWMVETFPIASAASAYLLASPTSFRQGLAGPGTLGWLALPVLLFAGIQLLPLGLSAPLVPGDASAGGISVASGDTWLGFLNLCGFSLLAIMVRIAARHSRAPAATAAARRLCGGGRLRDPWTCPAARGRYPAIRRKDRISRAGDGDLRQPQLLRHLSRHGLCLWASPGWQGNSVAPTTARAG